MRAWLYLCYEPQLTLSFPVSAEGPDLFTTYELLLQAAACPSEGGDLGSQFAGALNIAAPDGVWARQCLLYMMSLSGKYRLLFPVG